MEHFGSSPKSLLQRLEHVLKQGQLVGDLGAIDSGRDCRHTPAIPDQMSCPSPPPNTCGQLPP
jgi:hypothetical protein